MYADSACKNKDHLSLDVPLLFSHLGKRSSLQSFCILHSRNKMAQCISIKGESAALHILPCPPVVVGPHPDPLIITCFQLEGWRVTDIC